MISNLEFHKRTCTGPVAAAPVVKRRRVGDVVPEFAVRRNRRALGGHQRCMQWICKKQITYRHCRELLHLSNPQCQSTTVTIKLTNSMQLRVQDSQQCGSRFLTSTRYVPGRRCCYKICTETTAEAQQPCDEYISTPMLFTATDSLSFNNATACHICTKLLGDDKVLDPCHITGNYRGAAHNKCNLHYRMNPKSWKLLLSTT